jgi:hypothetical protein
MALLDEFDLLLLLIMLPPPLDLDEGIIVVVCYIYNGLMLLLTIAFIYSSLGIPSKLFMFAARESVRYSYYSR